VLAIFSKKGATNLSAAAWLVCAAIVATLYLTNLTSMGMYSTDEPRYADIGRAMARSGDWVTPRLWGKPWFEKPALLYWMTATGFRMGLGNDLAPRLPVALLSIAFIVFFRWRLKRVFDERVANFASAILATSAGWLAYSHVAVTDLPLAVFFSAAILFSLKADGAPPNRIAAAAALGIAVLAKSLPPLVLFLPVLVADRRNWHRWFASWPIIVFAAVALPWHVIGTLRNGWQFPRVLFLEQQFGRFFSNSLQHEQPWWFYIPVFLLFLFPWFPLLGASIRYIKEDERARTLSAVVAFGLVFFSASVNKLPGYVLPLVPAACAVTGLAMARTERRERWLIAPVALLGTLPIAAVILPEAEAHHLRTAQIPWISGALGIAVAAAIGVAIAKWFRSRAFPLAVLLAAAGFVLLEIDVFPALDKVGSARSLWIARHPDCAPELPRGMPYSLNYYAERALPGCAIVDKNAAPKR
jgi:4-amino-4-deoxy-L-arabinose transferase-like glycosyltransferase